MIFAYMPDPGSPLGVSSALQAVAPTVAVDEHIGMAQFRAFQHGIFPGLMIRIKDIADGWVAGGGQLTHVPILDARQKDELIHALQRLYSTSGYSRPLIVDGMIESVEKLSLTPAEMDFVQSAEHIEQRLYRAFGVNPIVLGQVEGANRASAYVAEESFCTNVVGPLAKLISDALTGWLGARYDVEVFLDPPRARDAELSLKAWTSAAGLGYVTANEFRDQWLGLGPLDGGDSTLMV